MAPKLAFFDPFFVAAVTENVVKHMVFRTWLLSWHVTLYVKNLANDDVFARSQAKTSQIPWFLLQRVKNHAKTMVLATWLTKKLGIYVVFSLQRVKNRAKTMVLATWGVRKK